MKYLILLPIFIVGSLPLTAFASIPTPVSAWNLNQSVTGGNATDAAGSNTLTNNNNIAYVSACGQGNGASLTSALSQYFSITNASQTGLNITGDMTIAGWVKFTALTTNDIFMSKWTNAGNQRQYEFSAPSGNTLEFDFTATGADTPGDYTNVSWTPSLATCYFLTMVYSSSAKTVKYYVNGTQQGTTQSVSDNNILSGTSAFGVGARPGATQPVNGLMNMWMIWNSALSTANITSLYNAGTGQPYPFPVAATFVPWQLQEF